MRRARDRCRSFDRKGFAGGKLVAVYCRLEEQRVARIQLVIVRQEKSHVETSCDRRGPYVLDDEGELEFIHPPAGLPGQGDDLPGEIRRCDKGSNAARVGVDNKAGLPALDGSSDPSGTVAEQKLARPKRQRESAVGAEVMRDVICGEVIVLRSIRGVCIGWGAPC